MPSDSSRWFLTCCSYEVVEPGIEVPSVKTVQTLESPQMLTQFASRVMKFLISDLPVRRRRQRQSTMISIVETLESRKLLTGFVINPTYDPATIGNLPNHAAIEASINNVISQYEAEFSDPITVNIAFAGSTNPNDLAFSVAPRDSVPYPQFLTALKASQTSADDATAVGSLPNTTTEPVQNGDNVGISTANEKALGGIAARAPGIDGTVTINFSQMNINRTTIDPNNYDLASTAEHEIDEVLGLGSNMPDAGDTWIQDLFRYTPTGQRSYSTNANVQAFFSLDGHTDLIQFNQDSTADYGDWASGAVPHVQDAFGTPGQAGIADPNIEYRAFTIRQPAVHFEFTPAIPG